MHARWDSHTRIARIHSIRNVPATRGVRRDRHIPRGAHIEGRPHVRRPTGERIHVAQARVIARRKAADASPRRARNQR